MRILLPFAGALALSVPAAAQLPLQRQAAEQRQASQEGEVVTVTGRPKRMTTILKTVLQPSGTDQLGRYEVAVCPGISGAPRGTDHTLLRLIRANASAHGVRLEKPGCKPNAVALFVSSPDALVRGLKRTSPGYFGVIGSADFEKLASSGAPIRSWHVVETMGRDGEALAEVEGAGFGAESVKIVRNALPTRVFENTRQDILLGFAVIESTATVGKTLQQLADVISMHLFLDLGPDAAKSVGSDSILALFEPRPANRVAPAGMTAFDRGLLKGTYGVARNNYQARYQRYRIAREIAKTEMIAAAAVRTD